VATSNLKNQAEKEILRSLFLKTHHLLETHHLGCVKKGGERLNNKKGYWKNIQFSGNESKHYSNRILKGGSDSPNLP